jgi:hypothetical protein
MRFIHFSSGQPAQEQNRTSQTRPSHFSFRLFMPDEQWICLTDGDGCVSDRPELDNIHPILNFHCVCFYLAWQP